MPTAPAAIFVPSSAGGSPSAPGAVFVPTSSGGSPAAPGEVFVPTSAAGSPDAPGAVFSPTAAGGVAGSVIVAGAGNAEANGGYVPYGTVNGKVAVSKSGTNAVPRIAWAIGGDGAWVIELASDSFAYYAADDVATPDLVAAWTADGDPPAPTVTAVPAPDAPAAVFVPTSAAGTPDAPAAVFVPTSAAGTPDAPAAVFVPTSAAGTPDAPGAVFVPTTTGGPTGYPPAVHGVPSNALRNSDGIPLRNTDGSILLNTEP